MARTFVIGDIHGAYRALRQCLALADFDFENDQLICLGDVCDGWPETRQCIDELLKIKNLIYILGNHDLWTRQWIEIGYIDRAWFAQGGEATIKSYPDGVSVKHLEFLKNARPYYLTDNKLFVHAGINTKLSLDEQGLDVFLWDRNLARIALELYVKEIKGKLSAFDEIYIGHTPIPFSKPIQSCEVWMLDTGAGWSGVLSMMNLDTKEIFCSDAVPSLYPGIQGRSKKTT